MAMVYKNTVVRRLPMLRSFMPLPRLSLRVKTGDQIVVVVSAMGKTTDQLLAQAAEEVMKQSTSA